jgi:hypothetical protein
MFWLGALAVLFVLTVALTALGDDRRHEILDKSHPSDSTFGES